MIKVVKFKDWEFPLEKTENGVRSPELANHIATLLKSGALEYLVRLEKARKKVREQKKLENAN